MVTRSLPLFGTALLAGLLLFAGCRELPGASGDGSGAGEGGAGLLIFAFDRSSSVQDHELRHAGGLTRERLGRLEHGDRFVALEVLERSLDEEPKRWSERVPEARYPGQRTQRDSVARARFVRDAQAYIARFSDTEERERRSGTDILSTLHLVGEELRAHPDRSATLVLFSDMLQATRTMNMEGLVRMPPADWVRSQSENGALPDLTGLCVVVVGARNDTPGSRRVADFWEEYFQETGAVLRPENYAYRPVRIPERPCP